MTADWQSGLLSRGVDSGANAGEASGPPLGTSKARCSLLGVQVVCKPVSAPSPSLRAPLGGAIGSVNPILKAHGALSCRLYHYPAPWIPVQQVGVMVMNGLSWARCPGMTLGHEAAGKQEISGKDGQET